MQSKKLSLLESILKPLVMNGIAVIMWSYVFAPMYGFSFPISESLYISLFFYCTSVALGYIFRRVFTHIDTKIGEKL